MDRAGVKMRSVQRRCTSVRYMPVFRIGVRAGLSVERVGFVIAGSHRIAVAMGRIGSVSKARFTPAPFECRRC